MYVMEMLRGAHNARCDWKLRFSLARLHTQPLSYSHCVPQTCAGPLYLSHCSLSGCAYMYPLQANSNPLVIGKGSDPHFIQSQLIVVHEMRERLNSSLLSHMQEKAHS